MSFMDTAQLLGNLGEFIGSVVIVVTLIYLAMQVRQNTNALHAQSRQAVLSASLTELLSMMENPDIHLCYLKSDSMTPEEHTRMCYWLMAIMRVREFSWLQYQNGIIDVVQWGTESTVIQILLQADKNRCWWEVVGRKLYSQQFVRFVDDLIRDRPTSNDLVEIITDWSNRNAPAAA